MGLHARAVYVAVPRDQSTALELITRPAKHHCAIKYFKYYLPLEMAALVQMRGCFVNALTVCAEFRDVMVSWGQAACTMSVEYVVVVVLGVDSQT